jgi:hypothetical protein
MSKDTPMVVSAAKALCRRYAEQFGVDFEHSWKIYGEEFIEDALKAFEAAAVPNLLGFVEEYISAWEEGMAGDSYLLRMAQVAIAKATGEQQ